MFQNCQATSDIFLYSVNNRQEKDCLENWVLSGLKLDISKLTHVVFLVTISSIAWIGPQERINNLTYNFIFAIKQKETAKEVTSIDF
jgi:hypothetical protein